MLRALGTLDGFVKSLESITRLPLEKIILAIGIVEMNFLIRPSDRRGIELARYRNMRSKRRCSLCLQFALILGAGPVLHRPTSLVIHRLEWNLF